MPAIVPHAGHAYKGTFLYILKLLQLVPNKQETFFLLYINFLEDCHLFFTKHWFFLVLGACEFLVFLEYFVIPSRITESSKMLMNYAGKHWNVTISGIEEPVSFAYGHYIYLLCSGTWQKAIEKMAAISSKQRFRNYAV